MLIKRFLIVVAMILTVPRLLQAQDRSDTTPLIGEWQIVKVETKLFAQQGSRLLETKTYTSTEDMRTINAFVPLNIQFVDQGCIIESPAGIEKGTYLLKGNGILQYLQEDALRQLQQQLPKQATPTELTAIAGTEYAYRLPELSALELNMAAAFYKDNNRNLAVKLVYTCYYRKK